MQFSLIKPNNSVINYAEIIKFWTITWIWVLSSENRSSYLHYESQIQQKINKTKQEMFFFGFLSKRNDRCLDTVLVQPVMALRQAAALVTQLILTLWQAPIIKKETTN